MCRSFRPQGEGGSWKSALHSQKALDRANHWQAGEKRKTMVELQEAKFLGNSNRGAGGDEAFMRYDSSGEVSSVAGLSEVGSRCG